jgi:hypothetical protein
MNLNNLTYHGVRFGRLLAGHFKIHAIIDISARVTGFFPLQGSLLIYIV